MTNWEGIAREETPDAEIVGVYSGGEAVVRIIDGQDMEMVVLRSGAKDPIRRLEIKAPGQYGVHGGKAAMMAGGHLTVMNSEKIKALFSTE